MTVILFLIVLAVLVFVHELGHFLAAKASGIRVDEFGLGFPPKVFGFKKGETTYTLNAIPFGGFVKIFGENPDEESIGGPDKARSFFNKPKYIQTIVLAAGVTFNILFAWLLISAGFMIGAPAPEGFSSKVATENTQATIITVPAGSPAAAGGLKSGDKVLKLTAGSESTEGKLSVEQIQNFIANKQNQPVTFNVQRGQETLSLNVTPKEGIVADRAAIGVELSQVGTLRLNFFQSLWEGAKYTVFIIKATAVGLAQFLWQIVTGNANFGTVTGPVGIAGMVGDATRLGIVYLFTFTALISVNLAVINLIPFPALDGGRIFFVLIEKIKGSPISPKIANTVNAAGFALLLLLMLVVTYHDILNLFK